MRTKYNFIAAEGAHFGIVQSLAEVIAAIPNRFDMWDATADSVTEIGGAVAEWRGLGARFFEQTLADRRPILTDDGLRMMDPITFAPTHRMQLAGAQIGTRSAAVFAAKIKLVPSALDTDLHYIFGDQAVTTRLMYRYHSSNGRRLAFDVAGVAGSNVAEVPLPAGADGQMGVVVEVDGTALRMTTSWGGQSEVTLSASGINLPALYIGNTSNSGNDMPGWFQRLGIWTGTVTADQKAALLAWVS